MALNLAANTIISADSKGVIEYWDADTFLLPKNPKISFEFKTETGVCNFAKKSYFISYICNDFIFIGELSINV